MSANLVAAALGRRRLRHADFCAGRARTRESAKLITADVDERDREFHYRRTDRGRFLQTQVRHGNSRTASSAASRSRNMPTCCGGKPRPRTSRKQKNSPRPCHKVYPGKMLAYNCSPSFNWEANIDKATIAKFQRENRRDGLQVPVCHAGGFSTRSTNGMFELARGYKAEGMAAYSRLQQAEFASEKHGYSATRHQREVGTGYFDLVSTTITGGTSSTTGAARLDRSRAVQGARFGHPRSGS